MSYVELRSKLTKASKPHVCEWCGESIDKGHNYQRRAYIFEGDFQSSASHPECYAAMAEADDLDDGYEFGSFKRGTTEAKQYGE